ncbi:MAG TPA: SDR family NAD(P)-dependent oxidoreductase [Burkholderiaceae bacterium]|nr:SDR family NAD(P)-dependent oxidoreductase [Burkholderiaceae bacterium]
MAGRLAQRVALITGGGSGIGAATALRFCAEGAAVTLVDRDAAGLARTRDKVLQETPQARVELFQADIADAPLAEAAVAHCVARLGALQVLVNNASIRNYSALADADPAQWRQMLDVNLVGTASYCRAALPALKAAGGGSIVNVSSCYGVTGRAGMGLYDATKAAQLSLTRTLAIEQAGHGIRVNAVCPGSTLTEFHLARAQAAGKSEQTLRGERQFTSVLGRWADPSEIAWPILWLASDEASYITGASLMVDGGLSIL